MQFVASVVLPAKAGRLRNSLSVSTAITAVWSKAPPSPAGDAAAGVAPWGRVENRGESFVGGTVAGERPPARYRRAHSGNRHRAVRARAGCRWRARATPRPRRRRPAARSGRARSRDRGSRRSPAPRGRPANPAPPVARCAGRRSPGRAGSAPRSRCGGRRARRGAKTSKRSSRRPSERLAPSCAQGTAVTRSSPAGGRARAAPAIAVRSKPTGVVAATAGKANSTRLNADNRARQRAEEAMNSPLRKRAHTRAGRRRCQGKTALRPALPFDCLCRPLLESADALSADELRSPAA